MRGGGENLALEYAGKGVRVASVRFAPSVHGIGDPGFLASITAAARKHGVSAYIGDGNTAWSAVHRPAAAQLIRLGLEKRTRRVAAARRRGRSRHDKGNRRGHRAHARRPGGFGRPRERC